MNASSPHISRSCAGACCNASRHLTRITTASAEPHVPVDGAAAFLWNARRPAPVRPLPHRGADRHLGEPARRNSCAPPRANCMRLRHAGCDQRRTPCDTIPPEGHHAFAYSPSKLGSLLPPDEYKAKARPAKAAKKSAEGDASTAGDYGPASVAQPMIEAANTAAPLRAVASSAPEAASAPRAAARRGRRPRCCSRCRRPPNRRHRSSHATTSRPPTNRPPRPRAMPAPRRSRAAASPPKPNCRSCSCSTPTC